MKNLSTVAVSASWVDLATDGKNITRKLKTLEANADSTGSYALCGVPTTTGLSIRATSDSAESGIFGIDPLDTERIARRDLKLGTLLAEVLTAKLGATLAGKVLADSAAGPLGNAEVEIEGTDRRVTTGADGAFVFTDMVPGTYTLHARRIGYAEVVSRVDLEENEKRDHNVVLAKATALDSVKVTAAPIPRDQALRGFEEHRKLGLGKFLTREDLDKAGERPVSSLLKQFNGLDVIRTSGGRNVLVSKRGVKSLSGPSSCPVMVYLDGIYYAPSAQPDVDEFMPRDLEGVEYFAGAGRIPPEYNRLGSPCGVLVIHTRKK